MLAINDWMLDRADRTRSASWSAELAAGAHALLAGGAVTAVELWEACFLFLAVFLDTEEVERSAGGSSLWIFSMNSAKLFMRSSNKSSRSLGTGHSLMLGVFGFLPNEHSIR